MFRLKWITNNKREHISHGTDLGNMSGSRNYNLNSQSSVRCEGMANQKINVTVFATHNDLGLVFVRVL